MKFVGEILPKILRYRLCRFGLIGPGTPLNFTFSVTNECQSRCRTCLIWKSYREHPEKQNEELTTGEIEKIFRSIGHVYIFNISGGEPFLRSDIVDIIELACRHLTPGVIHIPTNAIALKKVENKTREALEMIRAIDPSIQLTVKPSLDHIGEKHDEIRGVPGNFKKVMNLFSRLKALQSDYSNLHAELGTVISRWNVNDVDEIARFVTKLGVDSYRNEIAEQRSEMFNMEHPITPNAEQYERAVGYFVYQIKSHMKSRVFFQRMTNAFRLVYYDTAIRILKENRQMIPCYAGISNAHLSPYGDIWACCTLGYEKSMGNLREHSYDFKALWNSRQAKEVRAYIRNGYCACPLANQAYSNILLHGPSLFSVMREIRKE
jgi:MoaA/NifB/PqqE/SkfB family radical SAM enzyme